MLKPFVSMRSFAFIAAGVLLRIFNHTSSGPHALPPTNAWDRFKVRRCQLCVPRYYAAVMLLSRWSFIVCMTAGVATWCTSQGCVHHAC